MATARDILSMEIILCLILKNLPPSDILVCRRVCTYFNNVINTSREVKYACYLPISPRAGSVSDQTPTMKAPTDLERVSRYLKSEHRKRIVEDMWLLAEQDDSMSETASADSISYSFNPLLEAICPRFFNAPDDTMWKRWDSVEEHRTAFMRKGASWATMTLTQPPVTSLAIVHIENSWRHGKSYRYGSIVMPDGLTMGMLYGYVCKHLARPYSTFLVDWSRGDTEYDFDSMTWKDLYPLGEEKGRTVDLQDFQAVLFCTGVDENDHFHYNGRYDREKSYGQKWLAKWTPEGEDMLKDIRVTRIDGSEMAANAFMKLKTR